MMQSGLFVGATEFAAPLSPAVLTHYKRPEDASMRHGKFEEELSRMGEIVSHVRANALVLFNESFASTNEREGAQVAGEIVVALLESGVRVFFVTHMFALAERFLLPGRTGVQFLRAERRVDGKRTFRVIEGLPESTSYGHDLFREIFGSEKERDRA
jgi:DNA mismatch repair ATPase MutS